MTEREEDHAEVEAAREAVRTAMRNARKTDAVLESIHRSSAEIRTIAQANGYVSRFRQVLRGAN